MGISITYLKKLWFPCSWKYICKCWVLYVGVWTKEMNAWFFTYLVCVINYVIRVKTSILWNKSIHCCLLTLVFQLSTYCTSTTTIDKQKPHHPPLSLYIFSLSTGYVCVLGLQLHSVKIRITLFFHIANSFQNRYWWMIFIYVYSFSDINHKEIICC